jgi:hypothetical protein
MKRHVTPFSWLCGSLAPACAALVAGTTLGAAETHVVVAHLNSTWTYAGKTSSALEPLLVDDLTVGDIVEIQVPRGSGTHGFMTIKKASGGPTTEITDPVLTCGEPQSAKPNAVLREVECGGASKFNVAFTGSLKLKVLPTFKDPVDFYCNLHRGKMPGTLKLRTPAP